MVEKTVYIEYKEAQVATDPYSIELGSADNTYGIRREDTNEVLVDDGEDVTHEATGRYSFTTDFEEGVTYLVSWRIKPTVSSQNRYEVQKVGPFSSASSTRVTPAYKGTFTQGTFGTVYVKLFDSGGMPTDPESISVAIVNQTSNVEALSEFPTKLSTGVYLLDWSIPSDQAAGGYNVVWTYVINGQTKTEVYEIVVAEVGYDAYTNGILSVMRLRTEQYLAALQNIPIYMLQANPTDDFKHYTFPYKRWNQSAGVRVYRNQTLITSGFEVDYLRGQIIFDQRQLEQDQIHADFNFRFFADEDLDLFLMQSLMWLNNCPPQTPRMGFTNMNHQYAVAILHGAVVEAIRTFMMAMMMPQYRVLFENSETADKNFDRYETIKKNYEESIKTVCENKKLGPYKGLTSVIIQPLFTLPGGRARFFRYLFGGGM